MKKQVLSSIASICAFTAFAQLPVSNAPENKKAVLEEFTGIHCGYCPDGHHIASQIYTNDPDNVVLINIHEGAFAVPQSGYLDLTTYVGAQIGGQFGVSSWPNGTMNRSIVTGTNILISDRGQWAAAANTIKAQAAYCNVAVEGYIDTVSYFDPNTGNHMNILTATAEVYYTANSPANTNYLNIVLLEDSIHGFQLNYGNYNPTNYNADGTYNHNHVFRAMLTPGNFGKAIPSTTAALGNTYTTTITYTIPATYNYGGISGNETVPNIYQMHLAAFVTETSQKKTINAANGPIGYRTGVYTGIKTNSMANNVSLYPNPANGLAKVRVNADKTSSVAVSVYNQVGQLVFETGSKDLSTGANDIEINTQAWAAGLYNVVVKTNAGITAKKLNVVK